jgi:Tol biopolymer transport system component/DNA-binding winged helix-turn-helix (wHTH) protein
VQGDFKIGKNLVHPRVNAIERDGETIHLEPKVMLVLLALAAEAGEVVSREQIRSAVWPDVFVGEDVLIRAISEIRRAFADDPRSPHTIQTVPKVGYRLIASVSPLSEYPSEESVSLPNSSLEFLPPANVEKAVLAFPDASSKMEVRGVEKSVLDRRLSIGLLALVGVVAVVAIAVGWRVGHRLNQAETFTSRPLTTYSGSQRLPAFSPDGSAIAFVWQREGERYGHIYVKQISSEAPSRLTTGTAEELNPSWSPDGRSIAFIRLGQTRSSIVVIPAIGGSESEVYSLPSASVREYGGIAWSGDGTSLIFPQKNTSDSSSSLLEINLQDRRVRTVTTPPQGWDGDWTPEISPDGTQLAFVRGAEYTARDIYLMSLPNGTPRRLTNDSRLIVGMTWTPDGGSIVFSSNRSGSLSLWRVPVHGGQPEHEPFGSDGGYGPSIARQVNRLVYSHGNATWSILTTNLGGERSDAEAELLTSSEQDASPHVSPTGDRIAFQSWRSGSQEIWTARMDGSDPVKLTSSGYASGSPSWSYDSQRIAFDSRPDGYAHIFVIDARGGTPHVITHGAYNDIVPSWSADGRWLYFCSNRTGLWQIWKAPADGSGTAQQVTTAGGMVGMASEDGHWLYFTRYGEPGIWRQPLGGGPARKIFDKLPAEYLNYWTLFKGNLYTLAQDGEQLSLQRIDPETGHAQVVHVLKHEATPFAGLSLTPDGQRIVYAELVRASSGLTLVENFQ